MSRTGRIWQDGGWVDISGEPPPPPWVDLGPGGGTGDPDLSTSPEGQAQAVYRPEGQAHTTATTLVIYMHGNNGEATTCVDNATHLAVTEALLAEGWVVASSEMHGNNWGNIQAVNDVVDLYEWCQLRLNITNVVLWGASMGGLAGWTVLANGLIPDTLGMFGTSPVCALGTAFADASWTNLIRVAHSIAGDDSNYATQTAGLDPALRNASVWAGKRLRAYAGTADITIPKADHADVLVAIADDTAAEATVVTTAGDHGAAANYPAAAIATWVNSIGGV